jgi:hypothetical protein
MFAVDLDLPVTQAAGSSVRPATPTFDDVAPEQLAGRAKLAFVGAWLAAEAPFTALDFAWPWMELRTACRTASCDTGMSHPLNVSQIGSCREVVS